MIQTVNIITAKRKQYIVTILHLTENWRERKIQVSFQKAYYI